MNESALSRRTLLKGLGALVAVPYLESIAPRALGAAAAASAPPRRLAFLYVPNGIHMPSWTPAAAGANFELPPTLEPMAPHRDEMLLLSGLACDKARGNGDGAGDHARAGGAFLTAAQPRKTMGANLRAGVSVDQICAQRFGDRTRLASLELGIERYRGAGDCDSGYSCVYEHTLAWRAPNAPLPIEISPKAVFDRMFSDNTNDAERLKRQKTRVSVLDAVLDEARQLDKRLGGADHDKLGQYLETVRDLELRIERAEAFEPAAIPVGAVQPGQTPTDLTEHIHLMGDLLALAFQTDATRVATFMLASEGSDLKYAMTGATEGHHTSSHHQGKPELIANIRKINRYHVEQLAYLTAKLKSIPEGEGTLLDHCMIVYGSGISDGDRHTHADLPILLVGKGGGGVETGRHLRFTSEIPVANLWMALLERMGAPINRFGDSTGALQGLG